MARWWGVAVRKATAYKVWGKVMKNGVTRQQQELANGGKVKWHGGGCNVMGATARPRGLNVGR